MGETIHIQAAAGDTDTYLAPAQTMPGWPVLLLHPWWGLNQAIRDLADRLADDGFMVMAPDLYDGTVLATADDAEASLETNATAPWVDLPMTVDGAADATGRAAQWPADLVTSRRAFGRSIRVRLPAPPRRAGRIQSGS